MIAAVFKTSWLCLRRDRAALALTFALPIVFFSIFAAVFGDLGRTRIQPIRTALVAGDDDATARLRELLAADVAIDLVSPGDSAGRDVALALLSRGAVTAVVVLPEDLELAMRSALERKPRFDLLIDGSHPMAGAVVSGSLQSAALVLLADALPPRWRPPRSGTGGGGPLAITVTDAVGGGRDASVSFFAAGIGVMFLLFAVSGRGAILIDERERGVLGRMMASRLRLGELLLGRYLFLATLGAAQVALMFVWGSIAFGLELWTPQHLSGFLVMTLAAAAAAAGFGLLLSVLCRSRAQLGGVSIVAVLVMSALGGSMFPRFLMPEGLRQLGLLTFNAWALDGYQKVFWYDAGLGELWPQLSVLSATALALVAASSAIARRRLAADLGS